LGESYSQTYIASDKTLAERPDVMRRFLKVMKAAGDLMVADTQMAAEAVKAMVPQADVAVIKLQADAAVPLIVNDVSKTRRHGKFLARHGQEDLGVGWSRRMAIRKNKIDPMQAVSMKYLGS